VYILYDKWATGGIVQSLPVVIVEHAQHDNMQDSLLLDELTAILGSGRFKKTLPSNLRT
jgi:hypothetical protein